MALAERDRDPRFMMKCKGRKTLETLYDDGHSRHRERERGERTAVREAGLKERCIIHCGKAHTSLI